MKIVDRGRGRTTAPASNPGRKIIPLPLASTQLGAPNKPGGWETGRPCSPKSSGREPPALCRHRRGLRGLRGEAAARRQAEGLERMGEAGRLALDIGVGERRPVRVLEEDGVRVGGPPRRQQIDERLDRHALCGDNSPVEDTGAELGTPATPVPVAEVAPAVYTDASPPRCAPWCCGQADGHRVLRPVVPW